MKYKAGDTVKIKNKRGNTWNIEGLMDKYIGQEVVIHEIVNEYRFIVKDEEVTNGFGVWSFLFSDIDKTTPTSHEK